MQLLNDDKKLLTNLIIILTVIFLSVIREQLFFTSPRIWAEEGTINIASILSNGLWTSLIKPHLGYFSLFNNYVVALGMGLLGLDKVSYITTTVSFLIILMTVMAPLVLKSKYWDTNLKLFLIVIFTLTIGHGEIWLNSITSQFYFCVFSCFFLLSDRQTIKGWKAVYVLFMIINGALTGITTIVLLPFYLFKMFKSRSRVGLDYIIIITLVIGCIIQLSSVIYLSQTEGLIRFSLSNLPNFPSAVLSNFFSIVNSNKVLKVLIFTPILVLSLTASLKEKTIYMPLLMAFYLSVMFAFLGLGMKGAPRYGYAPAVMVFVYSINFLFLYKGKLKYLIYLLTTIIFALSLNGFFKTKDVYNPAWVRYSIKNLKQNENGTKVIQFFPQVPGSNWSLTITDEDLETYK